MKKVFYLFIGMIFLSVTGISQDKMVKLEDTPEILRTFISTHYPNIQTAVIEKDDDSYDVRLQNGVELEFNENGEWKEIDGNFTAVPKSIIKMIPAQIPLYVNQMHQGHDIIKVKKEKNGYEVKLSGMPDTELEFDEAGMFKKLDR